MKINLKATDNLAPIRNQMKDLVTPNSKIIELGCGDGNLLFMLAPTINSGLGIDKSETLIKKATDQKTKTNITHINFLARDLDHRYKNSEHYDFSIASLFFHVIPVTDSVSLLNEMKQISNTILICAFSRPETAQQKLLLWLDQRFSDHYKNFISHQRQGYMEGLFEKVNYSNILTYETPIPFVKIYRIS